MGRIYLNLINYLFLNLLQLQQGNQTILPTYLPTYLPPYIPPYIPTYIPTYLYIYLYLGYCVRRYPLSLKIPLAAV